MRMAIMEANKIINIIAIDDENVNDFSTILNKELVSPDYLELTIGDYCEQGIWYRDVNGVKSSLPLPKPTKPVSEETV